MNIENIKEKAEKMIKAATEDLLAYRRCKSFMSLGKKEARVECAKILIGEFGEVHEEFKNIWIEWFV